MVNDPEARGAPTTNPGFERVRALADAVLYEGYLLYPYRKSAAKNQVRWQFGVLAPRAWTEARGQDDAGVTGSAESWHQRTECLLETTPEAVVWVRVRYLHLRHKRVERADDDRYTPVESLEAAGEIHLTFDEATPREVDFAIPLSELLAADRTFSVRSPGEEETRLLPGGAGRVVWRSHPVEATTTLSGEPLDGTPGAHRLRVYTQHTGCPISPDVPREEALGHSLIATHTIVAGSGLRFVSLTDPPSWAEPHARECHNLHTFPVLAGEVGSRDLLLSSPIILSDHPQVAPESPGDLHDAAEIDEILTLRTLLLTDEEKREARATDPRAAAIVDRVDDMPPEVFARLHGAIRSLRPVPPLPSPEPGDTGDTGGPTAVTTPPWWEEHGVDGPSPETDSVLVDGTSVAKGTRVRLCPRARGTDAQDMFLDGRDALVAAVFLDVDGSRHVAVTLEDDPAAELHSWYGRYLYFRPDEVRPLTDPSGERPERSHRVVDA